MARCARLLPRDLLLSFVLYIYFGLGYLLVVLPRILWTMLLYRGNERHWRAQALVSRFLQVFFRIVVYLGRPTTITIPEEVRQLRGRVLVCNHESYLDPLLFVATFERQSTAAKPVWFRVPMIASLLRTMGYLAPTGPRSSVAVMSERIETMRDHLANGGVLFLFPEGRRNRDGSIGDFRPGAFKLARYLGVDVELIRVRNTAALFPPDRLLFRTGSKAHIRLERLGRITAKELAASTSPHALAREVRERYRLAQAQPEVKST